MACPVTIKLTINDSVLQPRSWLVGEGVEPPMGGVPGRTQGKEVKSVQTAFNTKEILPISAGVLVRASKACQLLDAPRRRAGCGRGVRRTVRRAPHACTSCASKRECVVVACLRRRWRADEPLVRSPAMKFHAMSQNAGMTVRGSEEGALSLRASSPSKTASSRGRTSAKWGTLELGAGCRGATTGRVLDEFFL